ncbi:MAG: D-tyrosyl-tRNA(Tyr) deacylase [Candidatus Eisenbacteria bacterium]|nr:D-tyrosyl-tRNA(Tyr) deacylase [Candidatus Eisenbacteria bacterium]
MRALLQRVARARVSVGARVTGEIGTGLLVLLGATHGDGEADADWLARKVAGLRVFGDAAGHMNRDLIEAGGAALVVPQFTLYGDVRRGRRPDFVRAAPPEQAEPLFERFCVTLAAAGVRVERGAFREHMAVELVNDGPVSLLIESPARSGAAPPAAAAP